MSEPASAPTSAELVKNLVNRSMEIAWSHIEYPEFAPAKEALLARLAAYDALAAAARKVRASGRLGSMAFDDAILGVDGFPDLMKALSALDGSEE